MKAAYKTYTKKYNIDLQTSNDEAPKFLSYEEWEDERYSRVEE